MMHYIVDANGYLVGGQDTDVPPARSTTLEPPLGEGVLPRLVDGVWTLPGVALQLTPPDFLQLFTQDERIRMRQTRESNIYVDDLLRTLEDPRLLVVDLSSPSTIEAVNALGKGDSPLLSDTRINRILAGLPPEVSS